MPNLAAEEQLVLPYGLTLAHLEWLEVLPLRNPPSAELLSRLDDGEASVIALAVEQNIAEVLIDEHYGRKLALMNGLQVTGTIGILLRAKVEGLLGEIKPCIEIMRSNRVYLSSALVELVLKQAGEEA